MKMTDRAVVCAFACGLAAAAFGVKMSDSVPKGWNEDYAAACETAKKEGKLVLLAFSGSDWCGWCVKMEKEIYSDKKFIAGVKKRFVPVMIDNPRNKEILSPLAKKQNEKLVRQFAVTGYPSTVIVRPSGEVVKRFGGYKQGGPQSFLGDLNAVAAEPGKNEAGKAPDDRKAGGDGEEDGGADSDDRFFFEPSERVKVMARETKQRKENATSDFELSAFAGIEFGKPKADGAPKLETPYHLLSAVKRTAYTGGKLSGVTLAAAPADVKAMSAEDLRKQTSRLVRAIERDLGVRFAVTGTKIDFTGKKATIVVNSSKSAGVLSVQLTKKK
ncbi:MAG: thioredoxin family protein [Kiritimatiellae bacterium]|nr:thioredoxin family protein [Kiritimatiellia bacterium]